VPIECEDFSQSVREGKRPVGKIKDRIVPMYGRVMIWADEHHVIDFVGTTAR